MIVYQCTSMHSAVLRNLLVFRPCESRARSLGRWNAISSLLTGSLSMLHRQTEENHRTYLDSIALAGCKLQNQIMRVPSNSSCSSEGHSRMSWRSFSRMGSSFRLLGTPLTSATSFKSLRSQGTPPASAISIQQSNSTTPLEAVRRGRSARIGMPRSVREMSPLATIRRIASRRMSHEFANRSQKKDPIADDIEWPEELGQPRC